MTFRFPKWLLHEPFNLAYSPAGERGFPERLRVTLWDKIGHGYDGYGTSISWAAKAADRSRQKAKQTPTAERQRSNVERKKAAV